MIADYLESSLGVRPILLKSFAQVAQCVLELAVAVKHPGDYLSDDPSTSVRYGHRFTRILGKLHSKLSVSEGCKAPPHADALKLSDALSDHLESHGGPKEYLTNLKKTTLDLGLLGVDRHYIDQEYFGLNLWLRCMDDAALPPFKIFMTGTSAFAHRSSVLLARSSRVWPYSNYVPARSLFYGLRRIEALAVSAEKSRPHVTWRSWLAVPLAFSEVDVQTSTTNDQLVTVGAAELCSTRRVVHLDEITNAKDSGLNVEEALRPSILSLLNTAQREEVLTLCATAAKNAVKSLM
jgi:hypothetical protein